MASQRGPQILNAIENPSYFVDLNETEQLGTQVSDQSRQGTWRRVPERQTERSPEQRREQSWSNACSQAVDNGLESETKHCGTHACGQSRKGTWRQVPDRQTERSAERRREHRRSHRCSSACSYDSESETKHCGTHACGQSRQGIWRQVPDRLYHPSPEERGEQDPSIHRSDAFNNDFHNMQIAPMQQQMIATQMQSQMMMQHLYQQFQTQFNQTLAMHKAELRQLIEPMMEIQRLTMQNELKDVKLDLLRNRIRNLEDRARDSQRSGFDLRDLISPLVDLGKKFLL